MNTDIQLTELLSKIENLSEEVKECHAKIDSLKSELELLNLKSLLTSSPKSEKKYLTYQSASFENFIGLKVIHFVGIIVLIAGLTIGVKYAIDINLISPSVRILLTYLAACGLFIISLRLRKKYELFSTVLFSGSMASIYFTTYAAFAYYGMFSKTVAFIMMLSFTIFTVFTSLKYDRQEIAILALVGAYGIPFFVRGNTDNLWVLFSYIFLINTGVLFVSLKKYWLSLTYLSFFTTWVILFACLNVYPEHTYFNLQISFCLSYFTLFMISSLGFKIYKRDQITNSDTIIILVNTGCLYISLVILFSISNLTSIRDETLLFAFFYLAAGIITKKYLPLQRQLHFAIFSISSLAFVIFFGIMYTGLTITIIWGFLAIAYFITGMWFKLKIFRVAAIVLFAVTLVKLVAIDSIDFAPVEKVIAFIFTGTVLLIVSFLYQKFKKRIFDDVEDLDNGSS